MAAYITEVLQEINDNPALLQSTYKCVGNGGPLGTLFKHAFMEEYKFKLPAGLPPYTPDIVDHLVYERCHNICHSSSLQHYSDNHAPFYEVRQTYAALR